MAQNDDTITKTTNPGDFDLMTIFQGQLNALVKLNRIQPIDTSLLQHFDDLFPFFRQDEAFRRNGHVYAVPIAWGPILVCYDEEKTDKPESYEDLMRPELKGKIAMVDDAYAGISTFARWAGYQEANRLTPKQLDECIRLAARLKPQLLAIAPSYGELPAMYKRGEIAASIVDIMNTVALARADGRKVSATVPKEGGISYVDCWEVVTGATNLAGAYAVMDATISPHGQAVIGNYTFLGMCNPKALPDIQADINAPLPLRQPRRRLRAGSALRRRARGQRRGNARDPSGVGAALVGVQVALIAPAGGRGTWASTGQGPARAAGSSSTASPSASAKRPPSMTYRSRSSAASS